MSSVKFDGQEEEDAPCVNNYHKEGTVDGAYQHWVLREEVTRKRMTTIWMPQASRGLLGLHSGEVESVKGPEEEMHMRPVLLSDLLYSTVAICQLACAERRCI